MINKAIKNLLISTTLVSLILLIYFMLIISSLRVEQNAVFIIEKNSSTRLISQKLAEQKIIHNQVAFFIFAKFYSKLYDKPIISGEYNLKSGLDLIDLMKVLTGGKVLQHTLTIPEGFTVKQVLARIATMKNIEHLPIAINNIDEGTIMPDTYFYTYRTFDIELIKRMQKAMVDFIAVEWPKRDVKIDQFISSPNEALTLASIVEKETDIDSERPMIAGVYLNRLKKNMKLQACPTVIYGLNLSDNPDWDRKVLYSHLKSESEYNTYMNLGLPPKPICNPGRKAILAVLHPKWSEKLFFVFKPTGKHVFAENFEEHKANIKKIRQ
jgi:UPF0755 protein